MGIVLRLELCAKAVRHTVEKRRQLSHGCTQICTDQTDQENRIVIACEVWSGNNESNEERTRHEAPKSYLTLQLSVLLTIRSPARDKDSRAEKAPSSSLALGGGRSSRQVRWVNICADRSIHDQRIQVVFQVGVAVVDQVAIPRIFGVQSLCQFPAVVHAVVVFIRNGIQRVQFGPAADVGL